MDYQKKLLTGSIFISASSGIIQVLTILQSVIVARILGPENLGIFAILHSIGAIVVPIIMCGIPVTMTKFVAEYETTEKKNPLSMMLSNGLTMILMLSIMGSIFYFISSDFIALRVYNEPILGLLIKVSAISIIFSALLNFSISTLQGFQKMKTLALLNTVNATITLSIVSFFVIKMNLLGAVIGGLISIILSSILILLVIFRTFEQRQLKLEFKLDKKIIKKILIFSFPLLISILIVRPAYLFGNSYLFITHGSGDVGLFKIAFGLYNIMLFLPSIISVPLLPLISELHAGDTSVRQIINSKILRLVMFAALPLCISGALFSRYIIYLLYGLQYIDAQFVAYIMIITAFFSTLIVISANIFTGTGRTWQGLYFDILLVISFYLFSYYFISFYGLIGLGLAYLLSAIIQFPLVIAYLTKKSEMNFDFIRKPLMAALIFIPASFFIIIYTHGLIFLVYSSILVVGVLVSEYYLMTEDDKKLMVNVLRIVTKTKR